MQHALAYLDAVYHFEFADSLDLERARVVELATRGRVEGTLVQNHQIAFVVVELVEEYFDDLSFEFVHLSVFVVQVVGLFEVSGVVKDDFGLFGGTLLTDRDLVVEVTGLGHFTDLGDLVSGDAPTLHSNDPIVKLELSLLLLDQLVQLLFLVLVSCLPPDVLYFDDLVEALILGELPEDTFQIGLVAVEDLQEVGGNLFIRAHSE